MLPDNRHQGPMTWHVHGTPVATYRHTLINVLIIVFLGLFISYGWAAGWIIGLGIYYLIIYLSRKARGL